MNIFASDILFYVFGALAILLSLMVIFMRNPVSSAMMMALSFGATAAVMIGLGAHFLGILQILVYAGAIMVLFAFIIMLLNVKQEVSPFKRPISVAMGVIIAALFLGQLIGIIRSLPGAKESTCCPVAAAEQAWNDLKIGQSQDTKPCQKEICVSSVGTPSITIPPLSPKCSAHLYPEGTTIRTEIDNGEFPDTALLGRTLFDKYNRSLIIAGLALLVASIGVVVLSRRPSGK